MCPLYYYHQQHPVNLLLLGLFTATISLTVGISCALTNEILAKLYGIHSAAQGARVPARWETYDQVAFQNYYRYRPSSIAFRAMTFVSEIAMLIYWHFVQKDIQKRADKLRRSLIRLGPFYNKLGQALSTRPDILPNAYCMELAKLQGFAGTRGDLVAVVDVMISKKVPELHVATERKDTCMPSAAPRRAPGG